MNKRGNVSLFVLFVMVSVIIVFLAAIVAPILQNWTVRTYANSEFILQDTNQIAEQIQDANVKASLQNMIQQQKDNVVTNSDILGAMHQYGWAFVIGIIGIAFFMYARQITEVGGGVS